MSEDSPKGLRRILGSAWSRAGAAVAVLASGVALLFTLFPGLIPDPKAVLAAKLTVLSVEQGVSLGTYHRLYSDDVAERAGDDSLGSIIHLRIKTEGKKHGEVRLVRLRYGVKSKHALPDERRVSAEGFSPDTPNDEVIAPVWVADPGEGVDYFVRLMLYDDDALLDFADTAKIRPVAD